MVSLRSIFRSITRRPSRPSVPSPGISVQQARARELKVAPPSAEPKPITPSTRIFGTRETIGEAGARGVQVSPVGAPTPSPKALPETKVEPQALTITEQISQPQALTVERQLSTSIEEAKEQGLKVAPPSAIPQFDISKPTTIFGIKDIRPTADIPKITPRLGGGVFAPSPKVAGLDISPEPEISLLGRIKRAPERARRAGRELVGVGEFQGLGVSSFIGEGLTGFGIFTGAGKRRAEQELPQLPFETRGTVTDIRVSPTTIGRQQQELVLAGGGGGQLQLEVRRLERGVTQEFQRKVDIGELDIETAQVEAEKAFQSGLKEPSIKEKEIIRGAVVSTGDLGERFITPRDIGTAGTVGGLIVSPVVVGGGLAGEAISSAVPELGRVALQEDLTLKERGKLLGSAGVKLGVGFTLGAGAGRTIARQVDRESLKFLESGKIDIQKGIRLERGGRTIDILKGTRETGSGRLTTDLILGSETAGGRTLTTGRGAQTLEFFSFETGAPTITTRTFDITARGIPTTGSQIKGFRGFVSTGEIVPTSELKISGIGIRKGRAEFETELIRFPRRGDPFTTAGLSKETKEAVGFISGRPTSLVGTTEDIGRITITPRGTGFPQEFNIRELTGITAGGFQPRAVGALRRIKLDVPEDKGFDFVRGAGRRTVTRFETPSVSAFGIEERATRTFIKTQLPKATITPPRLLGSGLPRAVGGQGLESTTLETSRIFSGIRPPQIGVRETGRFDISLGVPGGKGGFITPAVSPRERLDFAVPSSLSLQPTLLGVQQRPITGLAPQFLTGVVEAPASRIRLGQIQQPRIAQVQAPRLLQRLRTEQVLGDPFVTPRIGRPRVTPRDGFGLPFAFPPLLGGARRRPGRQRRARPSVPIRPSFTGIVTGGGIRSPLVGTEFETPAFTSEFLGRDIGITPGTLRGTRTGLAPPRKKKKKSKKSKK